jgi:hypothetical protein
MLSERLKTENSALSGLAATTLAIPSPPGSQDQKTAESVDHLAGKSKHDLPFGLRCNAPQSSLPERLISLTLISARTDGIVTETAKQS